jgi:hypothetical protein
MADDQHVRGRRLLRQVHDVRHLAGVLVDAMMRTVSAAIASCA